MKDPTHRVKPELMVLFTIWRRFIRRLILQKKNQRASFHKKQEQKSGNTNLPVIHENHYENMQATGIKKGHSLSRNGLFLSSDKDFVYFLILSTTALKASGWFIAKSARTLRLIWISFFDNSPINFE